VSIEVKKAFAMMLRQTLFLVRLAVHGSSFIWYE
jgi:hypothetical protein